MELEYVEGKSNVVADALSRLTCNVEATTTEGFLGYHDFNFYSEEEINAIPCLVCGESDDEGRTFYLCDKCGHGTHADCMHPDRDMRTDMVFWYCSHCVSNLDKDDPA